MSIKTKNAGSYSDIVGVSYKRAGAYGATQGVFVKSGGAYGQIDRQKPALDYLMLVGSSTTQESYGAHSQYGRQEHAGRAAMISAGADVPVINMAVGGSTIAALDSNINAYLGGLVGVAGKKVGVLVNIGSNDIGTTSYSAMAPATRDAMDAGLNSIISKIVAAGHIPILATVHSKFGQQPAYDSWAVNLYRPKALALTPDWCASGAPLFDYCQLFGQHQSDADTLSTSGANIISASDGISDWWQSDSTHPLLGAAGYRAYTSAVLAANATLKPAPAKESFIFGWAPTAAFVGGINYFTVTGAGDANGAKTTLFNNKGQQVAGVSLTIAGATGAGSAVRAAVGTPDVGINNSALQRGYLYSSPGAHTITFNGGAAYANRTGTARFTFNTSNTGRITRFSIGAASVDITGNASGLQSGSISFTADASGVVVVTVGVASGTYASVSGMEIEFD